VEELESISYGTAVVRLYVRSNGMVALSWREAGKTHKTTRATLAKAREFGKRKARELDAASGAQWVSPARQERLGALERIAGSEDGMIALLAGVERAVRILGGVEHIEDAARYFVTHGPRAVAKQVTLGEAVALLLREYDAAPRITMTSMKNEWQRFSKGREDLPLLEVTREMLEEHFRAQAWGARTRRNALTRWATFFRRARELELWPRERPIPTEAIKRQKEADKAPEIFTPTVGKILLGTVRKKFPQYLPYLLLAGWCGVRPSECLRMRWRNVDLEHNQLHLTVDVVGKTLRERWLPMPEGMAALLAEYQGEEDEKICRAASVENISKHVRHHLKMEWPADVLRHSYITYRLQILGDISKVAEEAGNSPTIIRKHYRRPIPPGRGNLWFQVLSDQ
jgi:integrase